MKYVSTRGSAPVLEFADVLLAGLARDGGLYVPETWPTLAADVLEAAVEGSYADTALEVMWPYVEGSIERDDFARIVTDSYAVFDHPEVTPLRDLGDGNWLLELFHGPTLAFKDVALQLVGRLFDHELRRRSERVTIVGATSGDTGSAAIEACRDRDAIEIFIMHPAGRVSDVQRRQMTTVLSTNVHNIAIDGTFDDCQDVVKALFADEAFRDRNQLSAVNSINWARVMAQIVYYVVAAARVPRLDGRPDPTRPTSFAVPTGNFGNVFAGYAAQRMGLPVSQFVVGSNSNDILTRFFTTGTMTISGVHPTLSPSMDIQVSSNLERLLFELFGRDGIAIADLMQQFRAEGSVAVDPERMNLLAEHWSGTSVDDVDTRAAIAELYERLGVLIDPHTAVGYAAARRLRTDAISPMITLSTAHPAKFPDAVEAATGIRPPLPAPLADLFEREEHYVTLPNDTVAIGNYIDGVLARRS